MNSIQRGLMVVAAILACIATGCRPADPVTRVLRYRGEFHVDLASWARKGDVIVAEIYVVPQMKPEIETLTVRFVAFNGAGQEIGSERVPLAVGDAEVGLAKAVRAELHINVGTGGLGVEIESVPPRSAWPEIPELAAFTGRS